jgi:hypothetical protein
VTEVKRQVGQARMTLRADHGLGQDEYGDPGTPKYISASYSVAERRSDCVKWICARWCTVGGVGQETENRMNSNPLFLVISA